MFASGSNPRPGVGDRRGGVGLGLRWEFIDEVANGPLLPIDFFEVSPENYMDRGGYFPAMLERVRERYAVTSHGLSLALSGTSPWSQPQIQGLRTELQRLGCGWHSDHLATGGDHPYALHELLPVRFCRSNALHTAERIRRAQHLLERPIAVENISYYVHPGLNDWTEAEFIGEVLERSGGGLLLDVNNAYVNSINHGFDAREFIRQLPLERVVEIHVAGHARWDAPSGSVSDQEGRDWLVDTHGSAVSDPVIELLGWTLARVGPVPVLLERDNAVPPLSTLVEEVKRLSRIVAGVATQNPPTIASSSQQV